MKSLRLALDWTPNVNHLVFFVTRERGIYRDEGIQLEIQDPAVDNYAVTPAKKVETGQADLALCPTESLISYQSKQTPFPLVGIASIYQEDLSAIAVKSDSRIHSPKDLDDKTYASYQARYEDGIVKQMIRNDGGEGTLRVDYPEKLGIWDTLLQGSFDATWIFLNWEGVQAETRGISLRYFKLGDYGIPYSYSPVIAADKTRISAQSTTYERFLRASLRGYEFCLSHPDIALEVLKSVVPEKDADIDLIIALRRSLLCMGPSDKWGIMDEATVGNFLRWLHEHQLETAELSPSDLITNELMEAAQG